jgi:mannonate dehydratase
MGKQSTDSYVKLRTEFEELPMRVGLGQLQELSEEKLQFASQMGIEDLLLSPHDPDDDSVDTFQRESAWSYEELVDLRERLEDAGFRLAAIERMPFSLYRILIDDGREEKIEIIKESIRNMGRAGIPILGYSGHPPTGVATTGTKVLRGGAEARLFESATFDETKLHNEGARLAMDLSVDASRDDAEDPWREFDVPLTELLDREYTEEQLWDRYEAFLEEILPVIEEAGVKLGLHPTDPPVEELAGLPLLFRSFENFKRALETIPSDNHGLKLCTGCWSEMGEDLPEAIRYFGGKKIFYIHFRDVVGTADDTFYETFIDDEQSNFDEYEVMKTLHEVGFNGVMMPDHVPQLSGSGMAWNPGDDRGRAFTIGYLRGLLKAVRYESDTTSERNRPGEPN